MARKSSKIGLSVIICLLILSLSLAINIDFSTGATAWWDSEWQYSRQISLHETSGYSLVQFPVEVTFEHSGKAQSSGNGIRIIDDAGAEVPYSLESISSASATVIFEVDLLPQSEKNYTIYYGHSQVSPPNYTLVPLDIKEGNVGNAKIDNRVFIGWTNVPWGVQPGHFLVGGNTVYIDNNPVTLWNDFRFDFDNDDIFEQDEDLLTDFDEWIGGIGRSHIGLENFVERSYGLGDYIKYIRTPVYVDLVFTDVKLRIYEGQSFVETTQADRLQMESTSWDYSTYQGGTEENIIDGLNINGPLNDPTWNTLYSSSINPGWMAYRNSMTGYVIGTIGFSTNPAYSFRLAAKATHAFDRLIYFDWTDSQIQDPYDQPSECKIYWYADNSNAYSNINQIAKILGKKPLVSILEEEISPSPSPSPTPEPKPGLFLPIEAIFGIGAIFIIAVIVIFIVLRKRK